MKWLTPYQYQHIKAGNILAFIISLNYTNLQFFKKNPIIFNKVSNFSKTLMYLLNTKFVWAVAMGPKLFILRVNTFSTVTI